MSAPMLDGASGFLLPVDMNIITLQKPGLRVGWIEGKDDTDQLTVCVVFRVEVEPRGILSLLAEIP